MSGNISTQKQQKQQKQYQDYVKKITPVHSLGLKMCKAFFTGGIICVLGQCILNYAKRYFRFLVFPYSDTDQRYPYRS